MDGWNTTYRTYWVSAYFQFRTCCSFQGASKTSTVFFWSKFPATFSPSCQVKTWWYVLCRCSITGRNSSNYMRRVWKCALITVQIVTGKAEDVGFKLGFRNWSGAIRLESAMIYFSDPGWRGVSWCWFLNTAPSYFKCDIRRSICEELFTPWCDVDHLRCLDVIDGMGMDDDERPQDESDRCGLDDSWPLYWHVALCKAIQWTMSLCFPITPKIEDGTWTPKVDPSGFLFGNHHFEVPLRFFLGGICSTLTPLFHATFPSQRLSSFEASVLHQVRFSSSRVTCNMAGKSPNF